MIRVISPQSDEQAQAMVAWTVQRLPFPVNFGPCIPLAVVDETTVLACVVYHDYRVKPFGATIEASIASDTPKWGARSVLRQLFWLPFVSLSCVSMTAVTGRKNHKARKMLNSMGFKMIGPIRRGYDGKNDAIAYDLLREECRWLGGSHGQKLSKAA